MILKIAWKNVWRSKGRSLVVMGSIVVGIWALIFGSGFMNGFMESYMAEVINHDVSNMQVHHPDFKKDYDVKLFIPNGDKKAEEIRSWPGVKAVTTRIIINGMISSSRKGSGVQIRGIDVEKEAEVTRLDSLVEEGAYFEGISRNPIIIGEKLADELKVKLRSKVVLTFNDANTDLTAAAFRVVGIVKSTSVKINETYAFVRKEDLYKLLGNGKNIHEIAVVTEFQNLKRVHWLVSPKNLQLKTAPIRKRISENEDGFTIELSSTTLQKNVFLFTDKKGKFSDNFFNILPNETYTVDFKTSDSTGNLQIITFNNFIR